MINLSGADQRLRTWSECPYESGLFTSQDIADLGIVLAALDEMRGYHWERWSVRLYFGAGVQTVEHVDEFAAREHMNSLLRETPWRADRIELARRVHSQGNWITVETKEDGS